MDETLQEMAYRMCTSRECGHDCCLYSDTIGCLLSTIDACPDIFERFEKLIGWAKENQ